LSGTISYYDRAAVQFFRDTVELDMSALYDPFLAHIPTGGRILDAGCGSGRDSRYFLRHGYKIEAFDASAEMCRLASSLIGQTVPHKSFEEVDSLSAFDGVWACASLLHVGRDRIDAVLQRLSLALKPSGVMFVSFKLRDSEWVQDGRFFNGYDENSLRELIKKHPSFVLCSIWTSDDVRPDRKHEKWLNALIRRVGD
jgi:2-polyprenyl-3-methyl-5-hydroxy-6-metoxy-1,4-benzoquinol methylase